MIEGGEYFARVSAASRLFDFAGNAIEEFGKSEKLSREICRGSSQQILDEEIWVKTKPDIRDWALQKVKPLPPAVMDKLVPVVKDLVPKRIEDVSNLLRQSQLITLSAHFETFMKDIHRAVLKARPDFLKADRSIPPGKLISKEKAEILDEEIEREVHGLDRKNVQQRAEHFRDSLQLSWEPHESIPEWCSNDVGAVSQIERLLNLRNKVLHEDPQVRISQRDSLIAFCIFALVPLTCCIRANKLYPEYFSPVLEEDATTPAVKRSN